jgi:hypothetical protein
MKFRAADIICAILSIKPPLYTFVPIPIPLDYSDGYTNTYNVLYNEFNTPHPSVYRDILRMVLV